MAQDEDVVTLGGHLTEGTICGIKVVIAVLVLDENGVSANQDPVTNSVDIFFRGK
jgi:hypothetical protein